MVGSKEEYVSLRHSNPSYIHKKSTTSKRIRGIGFTFKMSLFKKQRESAGAGDAWYK